MLDPLKDDIKELLLKETDGIGPDYVFECSGNPDAQLAALFLVRCFGTVCFAGVKTIKACRSCLPTISFTRRLS